MYNPISKAMRYLRREYPVLTLWTAMGVGTGICMGIVFGSVLHVVILGAVFGWFALGSAVSNGNGEPNRPDTNVVSLNGVKLVGNKRDGASIVMTQNLINSLTDKMQHLAELPKRTMRRIQAHIDDIQHCFARVRVYPETGGRSLGSFSFRRPIIDAAGNESTQVAVQCYVATGSPPLPKPIPRAPAPPPSSVSAESGPLAAAPSPKAEFNGLTNANQPLAPAHEGVEPQQPAFKL